MAEHFIWSPLDGKPENAYELAKQLGGMIFSRNISTYVETRAIDREAGKKPAEYIAQNYLEDSDIKPFKLKFNDLQQFNKNIQGGK